MIQELSHWCYTGACLSLEILIIKFVSKHMYWGPMYLESTKTTLWQPRCAFRECQLQIYDFKGHIKCFFWKIDDFLLRRQWGGQTRMSEWNFAEFSNTRGQAFRSVTTDFNEYPVSRMGSVMTTQIQKRTTPFWKCVLMNRTHFAIKLVHTQIWQNFD